MTTTIVIPCFNEERRLDQKAFLQLSEVEGVTLLFVDDGSFDGTIQILEEMSGKSTSIKLLILPENLGKGNAIRAGVLQAAQEGAQIVGYLDADLATPIDEMVRIVETLKAKPAISVVLGARVKRLGSTIERRNVRHYAGRAYATGAALALDIPVYDTQCGAKAMRVTPQLVAAFTEKFRSSWSFDVRLIHRLMSGTSSTTGLLSSEFYEMPLESWREVPGSKFRLRQGFKAVADLLAIAISRKFKIHKRMNRDQRNVRA